MRVLITGAGGFVGSRVANRLAGVGHEVRALLRSTTLRSRLPPEGIGIVEGDLTDDEAISAAVRGADAIVHCAALTSDWGPASEFHSSNVEGVRVLVEAARRSPNIRRFVHISTTDVYGYPSSPGDERTLLRDVGLPYNSTKIAGERIVFAAIDQGLPAVILRPATIYGAGGAAVLISMVEALRSSSMVHIDGGRADAGLIHVDDVVAAVELCLDAGHVVGRAFNLVNPEAVSWRRLTDVTAEELELRRPRFSVPLRAALVAARVNEAIARQRSVRPLVTRHAVLLLGRSQAFSSTLAQRELGFTPSVSFLDGIRPALAEFRTATIAPSGS